MVVVNPCQVGLPRRYQSVIQPLVAGDPIVSPAIPRLGALGQHDHLSVRARDLCSIPTEPDEPRCPLEVSWWTLTAHAFEVIRQNPVPANPLLPLTVEEIMAQGASASIVKGRAVLADSVMRQVVRDFDIGHETTFTWRGPNVELKVLTDADPTLGGPVDNKPAGLTGFTIADTLVQFSASPVVWGTGLTPHRNLQFTQTVLAVNAVAMNIPIPPGARSLIWYQVAGPAIVPQWIIDFPVAPIPIGTLPVLVVQDNPVPGNAQFLRFTLGGALPTQITFVWGLIV